MVRYELINGWDVVREVRGWEKEGCEKKRDIKKKEREKNIAKKGWGLMEPTKWRWERKRKREILRSLFLFLCAKKKLISHSRSANGPISTFWHERFFKKTLFHVLSLFDVAIIYMCNLILYERGNQQLLPSLCVDIIYEKGLIFIFFQNFYIPYTFLYNNVTSGIYSSLVVGSIFFLSSSFHTLKKQKGKKFIFILMQFAIFIIICTRNMCIAYLHVIYITIRIYMYS